MKPAITSLFWKLPMSCAVRLDSSLFWQLARRLTRRSTLQTFVWPLEHLLKQMREPLRVKHKVKTWRRPCGKPA